MCIRERGYAFGVRAVNTVLLAVKSLVLCVILNGSDSDRLRYTGLAVYGVANHVTDTVFVVGSPQTLRFPCLFYTSSRMSKDSGVTTRDNGVSQEVEARQGVSLKALVQVKPRVALRPFRTFLEVEQPVGEFLLRLDDDGNVGLFEACLLYTSRCV